MTMKIFLVGGAVRNLLLGRPAVDKDFLVNGISREAFIKRFPSAKEVGDKFPIFLLNGDEFSFFRADTLENDFLERDFTINSIAIDEKGDLFAHPKALEDLHSRKLDVSSDISFEIDPLRIFRAARFLSELDDFSASNNLLKKMCSASVNGLTHSIAAERIGKELLRALSSNRPSIFLELLDKTNNLKPWFNEFEKANDIPAGPAQYHDKSVLGHTMAVMDRLVGQGPLRVWMGMVHDLGKCITPAEMLPRHIDHDKGGEHMALALANRLRLSNTFAKAGANAARWHMIASRYPELKAGTKVKLLSGLGSQEAVADLFAVSRADRDGALDHAPMALYDYNRMRRVKLPTKHQNKGTTSGDILRQMQIETLSSHI